MLLGNYILEILSHKLDQYQLSSWVTTLDFIFLLKYVCSLWHIRGLFWFRSDFGRLSTVSVSTVSARPKHGKVISERINMGGRAWTLPDVSKPLPSHRHRQDTRPCTITWFWQQRNWRQLMHTVHAVWQMPWVTTSLSSGIVFGTSLVQEYEKKLLFAGRWLWFGRKKWVRT